jgi:hypothetical protein
VKTVEVFRAKLSPPAPSAWPFSSRVALWSAREGLRLLLAYNTSGYDSPEALALLDGPVEIYMPDMKYGDDICLA